MLWHILGWATVTSQVLGGAWLLRYLATVDYRPSWMADLPAPKVVADVQLSASSDFVGYV